MALVLGLAWAAVMVVSDNRLNQRVDVPRETIAVPTDITSIQRGQHLASAVAACVDCHGPSLAGKIFVDDPALGRIVSPNLNRGGIGSTFADADFVRAHTGFAIGGVAPLGHPAPLTTLVDEDLLAWDAIWAAGGHPHTVFRLTPDELLRIAAGRVVRVV